MGGAAAVQASVGRRIGGGGHGSAGAGAEGRGGRREASRCCVLDHQTLLL
jgi:hypothetical protein